MDFVSAGKRGLHPRKPIILSAWSTGSAAGLLGWFARNTVTVLKFARELKELGVGIFYVLKKKIALGEFVICDIIRYDVKKKK